MAGAQTALGVTSLLLLGDVLGDGALVDAHQAAVDVGSLRRGGVAVLVAQTELVADLVGEVLCGGVGAPGVLRGARPGVGARQLHRQMRLSAGDRGHHGDVQTLSGGEAVARIVERLLHSCRHPVPRRPAFGVGDRVGAGEGELDGEVHDRLAVMGEAAEA